MNHENPLLRLELDKEMPPHKKHYASLLLDQRRVFAKLIHRLMLQMLYVRNHQ